MAIKQYKSNFKVSICCAFYNRADAVFKRVSR